MTNSSISADGLKPLPRLDARALIEQLQQLRKTTVAELDWHRYCELMRQLCRATGAAVVNITGITGAVELLGLASEQTTWSPLSALPPDMDLFGKATEAGYSQSSITNTDGSSHIALIVVLKGLTNRYLVLAIRAQERTQLNELTLRALLCTDFAQQLIQQTATPIPGDIMEMLDLTAEVMQQRRFQEACLSLVNGITQKWKLQMAAFAWVTRGVPKLCAVSHLDRFERNAPQTALIENAMQPAILMGQEVLWSNDSQPLPMEDPLAEFAATVGAHRVMALPLKDTEGRIHAILLLTFSSDSTPVVDADRLLLALDLLQPRLTDLQQSSLGPWSRALNRLNSLSPAAFGPEGGLIKIGVLLCLGLCLYAGLGTWNYRIDASAQLSTEATRLISAPFDGLIAQVHATAGDQVLKDARLVSLDTRELDQQRAELMAELSKAGAEADKNRADGRLADMAMARARLDQASARLKRIQFYLQQAAILSPFDGIVVEGEKKELMGAPVKKGDKIFKVAKIEGLYVMLAVTERQMRHITAGAGGEISLLSHLEHNIPIRINSVIPVAQVKGQEGNQFMISAEILQAPQTWWRPGMTGLARIDVGPKSIAWILTHRMIDNLRMLLWW